MRRRAFHLRESLHRAPPAPLPRNGAFAHVRKPFDETALERRLREVLAAGEKATPERVVP